VARRNLKTISDVRRFLAFVIRETQHGRIAPELGTKLGYLANILTKTLELEHFEKKLKELEEVVNKTGIETRGELINNFNLLQGGK